MYKHQLNFSYLLGLSSFLLLFSMGLQAQTMDTDVPMGWAVVPGYGLESTTGGANGETVVATTAEELRAYAASTQPLVIMVKGTIAGEGKIGITSNKTIIGMGANATLTGLELNITDAANIIIRNLSITKARDGIASRRSHHVWIDHCDISECGDGAIDITNQSDLHTVSWTRLSNHDKTMLINSGTDHPEDIGTLNTTIHHNWWDGSNQRNPRVGYGKVHVFNSLYNPSPTVDPSYGIGLHSRALVLAEQNYFDGIKNPIQQMYRMDSTSIHHGFCESVNNIFNNSRGKQDDEGVSFKVNEYYLYDYVLDEASDVPSIVKSGAGPAEQFSTLGLLPTPGFGAITANPSLKWTKGKSATSYTITIGTTNPPTAITKTVSKTEFTPKELLPETDYYWKVDQNTPSGVIAGKVWMFRTTNPETN